jgi:hypothetical protein
MGDMQTAKSNGPNSDPCGTPHVQVVIAAKVEPKRTNCDLSAIYDFIHSNIEP